MTQAVNIFKDKCLYQSKKYGIKIRLPGKCIQVNKNVCLKWEACAQMVSAIAFVRYAHSQMIGYCSRK
jgi:hypothetical protein